MTRDSDQQPQDEEDAGMLSSDTSFQSDGSEKLSSDELTSGDEIKPVHVAAAAPVVGLAELKKVLATELSTDATQHYLNQIGRSEERRVGKECVSTCRSRWSQYH